MFNSFVRALIINLAITAIWYISEWTQYGELQLNRECDNVVSMLYLLTLWYLFWKNER